MSTVKHEVLNSGFPSTHVTKLGRILHIYKPSVVGAESGRSLKLLARQQKLDLVRDAVPKVRKKLIKRDT